MYMYKTMVLAYVYIVGICHEGGPTTLMTNINMIYISKTTVWLKIDVSTYRLRQVNSPVSWRVSLILLGLVTHLCIGNWVNIGLDKGLLPIRQQTIT